MGTHADVAADPPVGVRVYSDGMSKQHTQGAVSNVVAIVTMFLYTAWLHIMLALMVAAFFNRYALYTVLFLFSTLALPARPVLWSSFNRSWIFKTWREYFNFSYLFEQHLDHDKHYIFCEFPHGAVPLSPLIAGTLCQTLFPGFSIFSLAATSVFHIPFWRHFVAWIGSMPASRANFKRLLQKGSVAVIIGGIAEMYMQDATKERIKLRTRKGFVRMALEEGAAIVPVYHFGNTQLLDFGPQSLSGLSRKWRVSMGALHGRWGLPLPRRRPLFMVTGKPIAVPQMSKADPAYEATVEEVLATVVQQLQELYDKHKASYGWENRPLSIE